MSRRSTTFSKEAGFELYLVNAKETKVLTGPQAMCRRVSAGCDDRHIRLGIFLVAPSCRES